MIARNHIQRRRVILAIIMLLSLMPVNLVKALHFHEEQIHYVSDQDSVSQTCDCAICDFVLSVQEETPTVELPHIVSTILTVEQFKIIRRVRLINRQIISLRAPPMKCA